MGNHDAGKPPPETGAGDPADGATPPPPPAAPKGSGGASQPVTGRTLWDLVQNIFGDSPVGKLVIVSILVSMALFAVAQLFGPSELKAWWTTAEVDPAPVAPIVARAEFLDSDLRARIETLARTVEDTVRRSLQSLAEHGAERRVGAWAASQMLVAVHHLSDAERDAAFAFLRGQLDEDCACWRRFSLRERGPRVIAVTSWALLAHAAHGRAAPAGGVAFLLGSQRGDTGAFPIIRNRGGEEYGSTYSSAMAVLALDRMLEFGAAMGPNDRASLEHARCAAASWLYRYGDQQTGRWKDYPQHTNGLTSDGVSGLALHALATSGCYDERQLLAYASAWLADLPDVTDRLGLQEVSSSIFPPSADGATGYEDSTKYLVIPWALVATKDALDIARGGKVDTAVDAWTAGAVHRLEKVVPEEIKRDEVWRLSVYLSALRVAAGP